MGVPHVLVEYSANVADHHDIDALVEAVHTGALQTGVPPLAGLRTRAFARSAYRIADCHSSNAFVAVVVRIGPGRDAQTKTGLLEAVLDAAAQQIASEHGPLAIAWSAEIQEIDEAFRINRNHIRQRMEEDPA